MPSDLALLSILTGSNYPCLELIFMVPKVFEPLKFDCRKQFSLRLSIQRSEVSILQRKANILKFNVLRSYANILQ